MKKAMKGYMTVEISILFPIILLVLCTLFYLCFCFHDKVILNNDICRIAYCTRFSNMSDKEIRQKIIESLNKRLLISDVLSVEYTGAEDRGDIGAQIHINIPFILWDNEEYQTAVSVECPDKCKNIRKYRMIREVVN